jgi:hypothetical protein
MLQEYPTTRTSRRCQIGQRPLEPGEQYYSALVPNGPGLVRVDIAAENWQGPPENARGWWRCRMPEAESRKSMPAPPDVLLDLLTELLHHPSQSKLAYLLALLLVRRRILTESTSNQLLEGSPDISHRIASFTASDGRQWEVPISLPGDSRESQELQEKLVALMFAEE